MRKIKKLWGKCSLELKQWIILCLVGVEAALFYRFIIPIELKEIYGKHFVHIVNLSAHWIIFVPILSKLLNIRGK